MSSAMLKTNGTFGVIIAVPDRTGSAEPVGSGMLMFPPVRVMTPSKTSVSPKPNAPMLRATV